ncbi:MAG: hypothetical protein A2V88_17495 [Elusimicrobia bacterium RBG_16_66_12]|nr:MAG: hypothetical protein A2V88_17495 [Elusimicrobia bacterium RBG_16_66_12]
MSTGSIVGSLLFSAIGFVAFAYGKKTMKFRVMAMGGALMAFPYFVSDTTMMWLAGAGLTAALFFIWE